MKTGGDGLVARERTCWTLSKRRPRYLGIARCCFGGSIALGAPFDRIQHKGKLCALGNRNSSREMPTFRDLRILPAVTIMRRFTFFAKRSTARRMGRFPYGTPAQTSW